jgi:hypothetical protein
MFIQQLSLHQLEQHPPQGPEHSSASNNSTSKGADVFIVSLISVISSSGQLSLQGLQGCLHLQLLIGYLF